MSVTNVVKSRLTLLNAVVAITSVMGIFVIFELNKGISLHELNLAHLKHTAELQVLIKKTDFSSKEDIQAIREAILRVREQPLDCLEMRDFITVVGTKLIGTYEAFEVCEADLEIADRALYILEYIEDSRADSVFAVAGIIHIADKFHQHSYEFEPLVTKTVDALLILILLVMVFKGSAALVVSLFSSRSILNQVKHAEEMEQQLHGKNESLGRFISALKKQKQEVDLAKQLAEHNALHDPLTDLPNRRYLDKKISEIESLGHQVALVHIDVDHFKQVNDTKGHDAGDFILTHVSDTLKRVVREKDFVSRVGGDEFVVLANLESRSDNYEQVKNLCKRIVRTLRQPTSFKDEQCRVSVSVGAAIQDDSFTDIKELISRSDNALYQAKALGRNRYEIYSDDLNNAVVQQKNLSDELITALERDEIVAYYQPQFETKSLEISGMEALARWNHPVKGVISPAVFLPIAQELGVLAEIDRIILKQATEELKKLDALGIHVPTVSVNISSQRLCEPSFIDEIKTLDLPFERVTFELLESVYLDAADEQLTWTLDAIRELGIRLEIDDFGSGHASILGLLGVRPNRFKIDRQVIADIDKSETTRSLVKSIIGIGNSLDVEVVAEGIESTQHVLELQNLDCGFMQGYALGRPMTGSDLVDFFNKKPWLSILAA